MCRLSQTELRIGERRTEERYAAFIFGSPSHRFGFFRLPDVTGDPQFPEVVVKMLDFTWLNRTFLFFYTGPTSFDYTLTVTDTVTGAFRTNDSPGDFYGRVDVFSPNL